MTNSLVHTGRAHIGLDTRNILFSFLITVLIAGCKSNTGTGPNEGGGSGIAIKGKISSGSLAKNVGNRSVKSLADAKKVLLFYGQVYKLFDINDSTFTAYAQMGTATALAFLDANNNYIGNLCAGGLNVLPLVSLKDGENTIIDLSTLTLDGTNVIPANNPFGSTIEMTQEEVERFRQLGAYYESLSKNIDTDNDGVPDILDKKRIAINSVYSLYAGKWGIDDSVSAAFNPSGFFLNYKVRIEGGINLMPPDDIVTLSGPASAPYTDITFFRYAKAPDCFISEFFREAPPLPGSPFGNRYLPFERGTYTLTLNGNQNYTLQYSNVDAQYYMLIAVPTLHTDSLGMITSISVEYRLPDNTVVDPTNFVYQAVIQLSVPQVSGPNQIGTLYESPEARSWTEIRNFKVDPPLEYSKLNGLSVCYTDLIGNEYDIMWH